MIQRPRVYFRVCPSSGVETVADRVVVGQGDSSISLRTLDGLQSEVAFDGVFTESNTNKEVFAKVCPELLSAVEQGHNASLWTFGAPNTGKTHSIFGTPTNRGLVYHLAEQALLVSHVSTLEVSCVQLNEEGVFDLLNRNQKVKWAASITEAPENDESAKAMEGSGSTRLNPAATDHWTRSVPQIADNVWAPVPAANSVVPLLAEAEKQRKIDPLTGSSKSHVMTALRMHRCRGGVESTVQLSVYDLCGGAWTEAKSNEGLEAKDPNNALWISSSLVALMNSVEALAASPDSSVCCDGTATGLEQLLRRPAWRRDYIVALLCGDGLVSPSTLTTLHFGQSIIRVRQSLEGVDQTVTTAEGANTLVQAARFEASEQSVGLDAPFGVVPFGLYCTYCGILSMPRIESSAPCDALLGQAACQHSEHVLLSLAALAAMEASPIKGWKASDMVDLLLNAFEGLARKRRSVSTLLFQQLTRKTEDDSYKSLTEYQQLVEKDVAQLESRIKAAKGMQAAQREVVGALLFYLERARDGLTCISVWKGSRQRTLYDCQRLVSAARQAKGASQREPLDRLLAMVEQYLASDTFLQDPFVADRRSVERLRKEVQQTMSTPHIEAQLSKVSELLSDVFADIDKKAAKQCTGDRTKSVDGGGDAATSASNVVSALGPLLSGLPSTLAELSGFVARNPEARKHVQDGKIFEQIVRHSATLVGAQPHAALDALVHLSHVMDDNTVHQWENCGAMDVLVKALNNINQDLLSEDVFRALATIATSVCRSSKTRLLFVSHSMHERLLAAILDNTRMVQAAIALQHILTDTSVDELEKSTPRPFSEQLVTQLLRYVKEGAKSQQAAEGTLCAALSLLGTLVMRSPKLSLQVSNDGPAIAAIVEVCLRPMEGRRRRDVEPTLSALVLHHLVNNQPVILPSLEKSIAFDRLRREILRALCFSLTGSMRQERTCSEMVMMSADGALVPYTGHAFAGEWTSTTCGGASSLKMSLVDNPQYAFQLRKEGNMVITVEDRHAGLRERSKDPVFCILSMMNVAVWRITREQWDDGVKLVAPADKCYSPKNSAQYMNILTVKAMPNTTYAVVPLSDNGETGQFILTFFSDVPFEAKQLHQENGTRTEVEGAMVPHPIPVWRYPSLRVTPIRRGERQPDVVVSVSLVPQRWIDLAEQKQRKGNNAVAALQRQQEEYLAQLRSQDLGFAVRCYKEKTQTMELTNELPTTATRDVTLFAAFSVPARAPFVLVPCLVHTSTGEMTDPPSTLPFHMVVRSSIPCQVESWGNFDSALRVPCDCSQDSERSCTIALHVAGPMHVAAASVPKGAHEWSLLDTYASTPPHSSLTTQFLAGGAPMGANLVIRPRMAHSPSRLASLLPAKSALGEAATAFVVYIHANDSFMEAFLAPPKTSGGDEVAQEPMAASRCDVWRAALKFKELVREDVAALFDSVCSAPPPAAGTFSPTQGQKSPLPLSSPTNSSEQPSHAALEAEVIRLRRAAIETVRLLERQKIDKTIIKRVQQLFVRRSENAQQQPRASPSPQSPPATTPRSPIEEEDSIAMCPSGLDADVY